MAAINVQAQTVYRIVGPDGRVTFSDQPPPKTQPSTVPRPAGAPAASAPSSGASTASASALPASLRQAMQRYPVTFYADSDCPPCEDARQLLTQRGIPFTEKTVSSPADVQALRQLSGKTQLPFLTIGTQHLHGFETASWNSYLTAAGYPATSQLPAQYRRPPATPLAPEEKAPQTAAPAETSPTPASEVPGSAPEEAIDPSLFDPQRPQF